MPVSDVSNNNVANSSSTLATVPAAAGASAVGSVDPGDFFFTADKDNRYLGHSKAAYGFILVTDTTSETFVLPLNPQQIDQDEEAAVTIIPTQGGGKYIENRGSIFKDIVISGVTGFLPAANLKAFYSQQAATSRSDQSGMTRQDIADAGATFSGYAVFHKLRTLFRRYWDIKRNGNANQRLVTRMYYINTKDQEIWWVEPLAFRAPRNSKSPMTYAYQIRLRTIAKGLVSDIPPDPQPSVSFGSNTTSSGANQLASSSLQDLSDDSNMLAEFSDVASTVSSDVANVQDVVGTVMTGLRQITSGMDSVLNISKTLLDGATVSIDNIFTSFGDLATDVASIPLDFINALNGIRQTLDNLRSVPSLFSASWQNGWTSAATDFLPGPNGITAPSTSSALAVASFVPGTTVWSLASSLFGDVNKAYEIIAINKLSFPYFVDSVAQKRPGVLAPGDMVLVPTPGTSAPVSSGEMDFVQPYPSEADIVETATSVTLSKPSNTNAWRDNQWVGYTVVILDGNAVGQSQLVVSSDAFSVTVANPWSPVPTSDSLFQISYQGIVSAPPPSAGSYGVDVKLTPDNDFAVSGGDIQTVSGMDNFRQALDIKLETEQGTLLLHRWFGLLTGIGSKGTADSLFAARFNAERTLLSDTRVASVQGISVVLDRDVYQMKAYVVPRGSDVAQPIVKTI